MGNRKSLIIIITEKAEDYGWLGWLLLIVFALIAIGFVFFVSLLCVNGTIGAIKEMYKNGTFFPAVAAMGGLQILLILLTNSERSARLIPAAVATAVLMLISKPTESNNYTSTTADIVLMIVLLGGMSYLFSCLLEMLTGTSMRFFNFGNGSGVMILLSFLTGLSVIFTLLSIVSVFSSPAFEEFVRWIEHSALSRNVNLSFLYGIRKANIVCLILAIASCVLCIFGLYKSYHNLLRAPKFSFVLSRSINKDKYHTS